MAIKVYNNVNLSAGSRRIPEDRLSGTGATQTFTLVNVTSALLARVYVDEILQATITNFYSYLLLGTNFLYFYSAPALGTNNIVAQTDQCLFFPGGTAPTGQLNAYGGDTVDCVFYISNDDAAKGYNQVTITPNDFIGDDEAGWAKLATTQGGLDSAVAGAALNLGNIIDYDTDHPFWVRITVPAAYLAPNIPAFNKYDLSFLVSRAEYDI
jgi:hypothetical protein